MKLKIIITAVITLITVTVSVKSQIYHTGLSKGAKLHIHYADNEAFIYVTPQGEAERLIVHLPYADNNPYRNNFINIIPVNSAFAKIYTVRVVVKNEVNTTNINPLSFVAVVYSVGSDNATINDPFNVKIDPAINITLSGSGSSGAIREIIFQVQKMD